VRLQAEGLEVALHDGLGDAGVGGHRAYAPMRGAIGRLGVQRRLDQLRHTFIVNRARLVRTHIVVQTRDAPLVEPQAPLAHRGLGQIQALGDDAVAFASALLRTMRALVLKAAGSERLRAKE